jgi:hypothetical protein
MSRCYANPDPMYQPAMRLISAITNNKLAQVTTTFDHDYVSGTILRFIIPKACGMQQINNMVLEITVTGTNTFTVNLDTTGFDIFAIPVAPTQHENICAQLLAIGENNSRLDAAEGNVLT